jgi:antibiotic biosynthesis monooxygenase (ABM) superfamily enzyme
MALRDLDRDVNRARPATDGAGGPLTVIATRKVRPGHEETYEAWLAEIHAETRGFPGYLGAHVVRPAPGTEREYTNIIRFESLATLRAWEESDVRRAWLARLPAHAVEGDARLTQREGMELWITPQTQAAPVRWRMALVVIVVVYSLILILSPIVGFVAAKLPFLARLFLTVTVEVFLMTYVVMPRVTRWLGGWLFPQGR